MKNTDNDFVSLQRQFAAYVRGKNKIYDSNKRASLYKGLLFGNINEILRSTFPLIVKILSATTWERLIADFIHDHKAITPLFYEIPAEFLDYLWHGRSIIKNDPEWLKEVAHFDWIEIFLETNNERNDEGLVPINKIESNDIICTSCNAILLTYKYAVHHLLQATEKIDKLPRQDTYLLAYRDSNLIVNFFPIDILAARLFTLLQQNKKYTINEIEQRIISEIEADIDIHDIKQRCQNLFNSWSQQEILLIYK